MTIDEAIRRMECCRNFLKNNYSDMGEPNLTAFNMAIKALEQETVLDEIRAEIDSAKLPKNRMSFFRDGINTALDIIDKYKAESKEVNADADSD